MFASILGVFGWFRSTLGKWLLAAGLASGLWITHQVQIHHLSAKIADLKLELAEEKVASADLKASVSLQNQAIQTLKKQTAAMKKAADRRAKEELTNGNKRSEDLRSPNSTVGAGPEEMNKWLKEEFGHE